MLRNFFRNKFGKHIVPYSINDHIQRFLIIAIRLFLVGAIAYMATHGAAGPAGLVAVLLITTYVPHLLFERGYGVVLPIEFHFVIIAFLFSCIFLGAVSQVYWHVPWWDKAMHGVSGVMFGFLGFLIFYTLREQNKLNMSLKLVAMFAFCFSLAGGAMWELAEFGSDHFWGSGAQRNGNADTMNDLLYDAIGALVIAVAGYRYLKRGRGVLRRFVENFKHLNPQLFPADRSALQLAKRKK